MNPLEQVLEDLRKTNQSVAYGTVGDVAALLQRIKDADYCNLYSRDSMSDADIGRRWNLADNAHRRSWLLAAMGGNVNMHFAGTPFEQLNIHLQADLCKVYQRGTDMQAYKKV